MYKLIGLIIMGSFLYHDFNKDRGQHTKSKIVNGVILMGFTYMYCESFRYVGWMVRKFEKAKEYWAAPIGIIPGELHLLSNLCDIFAGIALIIFSFQAAKRKEDGRVWIMRVLPILALTGAISFYRGWMSDGYDYQINHFLILGIGASIFGGICIAIISIYRSQFMKDFFNPKEPDSISQFPEEDKE